MQAISVKLDTEVDRHLPPFEPPYERPYMVLEKPKYTFTIFNDRSEGKISVYQLSTTICWQELPSSNLLLKAPRKGPQEGTNTEYTVQYMILKPTNNS